MKRKKWIEKKRRAQVQWEKSVLGAQCRECVEKSVMSWADQGSTEVVTILDSVSQVLRATG